MSDTVVLDFTKRQVFVVTENGERRLLTKPLELQATSAAPPAK